MRKAILVFLNLAMVVLGACTDTQTCGATGLTPGHVYDYSYVDTDGATQSGSRTVDQNGTLTIPNVDGGINCGDLDVERALPVYIAN